MRLLLLAVILLLVVVLPVRVLADDDPPVVVPVGEVIAIDARRQIVGTVIGGVPPGSSPHVAMRVKGAGVILSLTLDKIQVSPTGGTRLPFQGTSDTAFFESADCSGSPFVLPSAYTFVWRETFVGAPGMTLYFAANPKASPTSMTRRSTREFDGRCTTSGPVVMPAVVAMRPVIDLLTVFTPPFRLVFLDRD